MSASSSHADSDSSAARPRSAAGRWIWALGCLLLPLCYVAYSTFAIRAHRNLWGALDALTFLSCLGLSTFCLTAVRSACLRFLLLLLVTGTLSFFFLANTAYCRFFGVWLAPELLRIEWHVGTSVFGGALRVFTWWDWVGGVVLPFSAMLLLARHRRRASFSIRKRIAVPGSLILILVLILGPLVRRSRVWASRQTPLLYFVREAAVLCAQGILRRVRSDAAAKRAKPIEARIWEHFPPPQAGYLLDTAPRYPLLKVPDPSVPCNPAIPLDRERPPNVVLILLESVRSREMGAYGADPSFTPNLDRIAKKSLLFRNYYSNGYCTVRGEFPLLCSYYPTATEPSTYHAYPNLKVSTLPDIFRNRGYETLWISGFNRNYSNQYNFLFRHGFNLFCDIRDLPSDVPKLGWGKPDHTVFEFAIGKLDRQRQPFFAQVVTMSNHWHWHWRYPTADETPRVSAGQTYVDYTRGIYYTDWAVGRFLEGAKKTGWFDNTIFVITADHGIRDESTYREDWQVNTFQETEIGYRVPLMLYGPRYIRPGRSKALGSHVDLAPTILALLGIRARNSFVGSSLLAPAQGRERQVLLFAPSAEWHLRKGAKYLYAVRRGDPAVRRLGADVGDSRHVLVECDGDILQSMDLDRVRVCPDEERRELVRRAEDVIFICGYLRDTDRIYDRKSQVRLPKP